MCVDRRSHHINAVPAASCRPLAAVGEAAVIGGGAVHVRRLQLHLAGGNGCVKLDLSSVHDVEHQADADDNLHGTDEEMCSMRQTFSGLFTFVGIFGVLIWCCYELNSNIF